MPDPTPQATPDSGPLLDPETFLRSSPLWREMQYDAINANLRRFANAEGFEIVSVKRINSSVVRLTAYVGNQDEQRTSLRCHSLVCGLLRSAGVSFRKSKVFARYRRSVIRCVFAPDWH